MQRYKLFLTQQQLEEKNLKRFLMTVYYTSHCSCSVSTSYLRLAVANAESLQLTANALSESGMQR
jgi:hypothetical protein